MSAKLKRPLRHRRGSNNRPAGIMHSVAVYHPDGRVERVSGPASFFSRQWTCDTVGGDFESSQSYYNKKFTDVFYSPDFEDRLIAVVLSSIEMPRDTPVNLKYSEDHLGCGYALEQRGTVIVMPSKLWVRQK